MNRYGVKAIDLNGIKTVDEYNEAVKKSVPYICNSLAEVWAYCGGRLHRTGCGYAGTDGNKDYIATKI